MPLAFQDIPHQVAVAGGRCTVEIVEGVHEGSSACVQRGFERREIDFPQCPEAHIHAVVITTTDGSTVGGEVLGTGHYSIQAPQAFTLETFYSCPGDAG